MQSTSWKQEAPRLDREVRSLRSLHSFLEKGTPRYHLVEADTRPRYLWCRVSIVAKFNDQSTIVTTDHSATIVVEFNNKWDYL